MNRLVQAMHGIKETENGAMTYSTSSNPLVDLFSLGGSYRRRTDEEIINLVRKSYNYDPEGTFKCLFYLRDIRGGQGERRFFRVGMKWIFKEIDNTSLQVYLMSLIPEYGRWDDLIYMMQEPFISGFANDVITGLISHQLVEDIQNMKEGKEISLLGKWLPSVNTSSPRTVEAAIRLRRKLRLHRKQYQQMLSSLRKYLKVVERDTSSKNWGNINYSIVPSKAMLKYARAFKRHDETRYSEYLRSVEKGEAKINTGTLYPSDIISKVRRESMSKAIQVMWDNLPDWINDKNRNALVMCDTSNSMTWGDKEPKPIDVAIALSIYFAERCNGEFHDSFLTFSEKPELIYFPEHMKTLKARFEFVNKSNWGGSTNINAAFELLLNRAAMHHITAEEMPKIIYIISDMEFDYCAQWTNYEFMCEQYKRYEYEVPRIVFWNVNARNDTIPVKSSQDGVSLISGYSPAVFKFAVEGGTPEDFMNNVLGSKRYEPISIDSSLIPEWIEKMCSKYFRKPSENKV